MVDGSAPMQQDGRGTTLAVGSKWTGGERERHLAEKEATKGWRREMMSEKTKIMEVMVPSRSP
jgi:hypothetical protein